MMQDKKKKYADSFILYLKKILSNIDDKVKKDNKIFFKKDKEIQNDANNFVYKSIQNSRLALKLHLSDLN